MPNCCHCGRVLTEDLSANLWITEGFCDLLCTVQYLHLVAESGTLEEVHREARLALKVLDEIFWRA